MWYNRKSDNRTLNLGNSDGQGEVSQCYISGGEKQEDSDGEKTLRQVYVHDW